MRDERTGTPFKACWNEVRHGVFLQRKCNVKLKYYHEFTCKFKNSNVEMSDISLFAELYSNLDLGVKCSLVEPFFLEFEA